MEIGRQHIFELISGFVGVPLGYLIYLGFPGLIGFTITDFSRVDAILTPLFLIILSITGGVIAYSWIHSLYGSAIIGGSVMILFPLTSGTIFTLRDARYALLFLAITAIATVINLFIQYPGRVLSYLKTYRGKIVAFGGAGFAFVSLILQFFSRSIDWINSFVLGNPLTSLVFIGLLFGAALVGAVVVWFCFEFNFVLPMTVTVVWVIWSFIRLYQLGPLSLGSFNYYRIIHLPGYPDALFQWPLILAGVIVAALIEQVARRAGQTWLTAAS